MDAQHEGPKPDAGPFDALQAESKAALAYSANTLRSVRERFREAHAHEQTRWQALYDQLETAERSRPAAAEAAARDSNPDSAAGAAEAGAEDARRRALRAEVERLGEELGNHESDLARLDLAIRNLETTWLFVERGDSSLLGEAPNPGSTVDFQMRIVEAQEAERTRLAQEVHDGPGQALTNAIFQVEYIERVITRDPRAAKAELRLLRDLLRRELGDVRGFISQLRPPVLDRLGLDGALREAIDHIATLIGVPIFANLEGPAERLGEAEQTVVLRVAQEALQNVRKHAAATSVTVSTELADGHWTLEVRDNGRGFDVAIVAARGRRNFGLQFMRERATLIGADFDVRSRPDGGTVVRLAIPMGGEESR